MAIRLDPAKCGTEGNWRAHRRRGENPCLACRMGLRRANRRRHETRRARRGGRPHHDQHCTRCGWYVKHDGTCVNRECA